MKEKKQSSRRHWQSSSNLVYDTATNPFAVRNNRYTKSTVFFHCIVHGVAVFFIVCVLLLFVTGGCLCECAFLQPRICQPHHNGQAVSQSLSIVAWMKHKLYWIHYTRRSIINSHLHPFRRIVVFSLSSRTKLNEWSWRIKFCQMTIGSTNVQSEKKTTQRKRVNSK